MMPRRFLTLLAALCCGVVASAQVQVMTIHRTDGTTVDYPVTTIDSVTFSTLEPAELDNEYEYNMAVTPITAVTEVCSVQGRTYRLDDAAQTGALSVSIPADGVGTTYDLSTAAAQGVALRLAGTDITEGLTGSLRVQKDKSGKFLTLVLEASWQGNTLRANYSGTYAIAYTASGRFTVTPASGTAYKGRMASVFTMTEGTGGTRHFAFGPVDTTSPADMRGGDCVVWFSVSAAKLGTGTFSVAEAAGSYTLRLIDYKRQVVTEALAGTTGTITTALDPEGSNNTFYIALDLTLQDGTHIVADYFGSTTTVASFDDLYFEQAAENSMIITNDVGEETANVPLVGMQMRESGIFTYFYLMKQPNDDPDDNFLTPMIKIKTSLIDTGEIDLATAEARTWEVKYQTFQLSSQDNEYMNKANDGTLSVSRNEDGTYSIYLDLLDSYTTPWGSTTGGTQSALRIFYDGPASPYTGSK